MADKQIINIVGQDLENPEMEEQYYEWYHERHLPELFKFKGMKKAARYKRIGDDATIPTYLTIYTFDSLKDFEEYNTSPERTVGARVGGRPEGVKGTMRGQYELIRSWEK